MRYGEGLAAINGVTPPYEPSWARSNWQSYAVRLDPAIDQRALMQRMLDENIATKTGIMNAHREPCMAAHLLRFPLPHSESAQDHSLMLPLFPGLTATQQDRVLETLQRSL